MGLRTAKLKFCFVWSVPVVFCLVTGGNGNAAMNFLLSCAPFPYMCTYSYATNHECYHHSFCSSISTIFLFSSSIFLREKVWEHCYLQILHKLSDQVRLVFPHPILESQPCKKLISCSSFPLILLSASDKSPLCFLFVIRTGFRLFWELDFPCYCEFIQEAPTKMSHKIWFVQQVWVLYCLHIRSMYATCVLLTCSF